MCLIIDPYCVRVVATVQRWHGNRRAKGGTVFLFSPPVDNCCHLGFPPRVSLSLCLCRWWWRGGASCGHGSDSMPWAFWADSERIFNLSFFSLDLWISTSAYYSLWAGRSANLSTWRKDYETQFRFCCWHSDHGVGSICRLHSRLLCSGCLWGAVMLLYFIDTPGRSATLSRITPSYGDLAGVDYVPQAGGFVAFIYVGF